MTQLNATDLSHLRDGHPHAIRPYISILKPPIVFCGRLDGAHTFGQRTLSVLTESGDINAVLSGMTMWVGASCGNDSKGKRRVRSTTIGEGNTITVDENSVDWDAGDYVTVYENWELWGIFQYINPATLVFYKDRDIVYTDQNSKPNPVAIMGWHRAKFLDGPTVTFDLDASDSYAIAFGKVITTYLWECDNGTIANPAAAVTTITFDAYGQYWVKLTVTDDNGKTQSTRRVLFVHSRNGNNAPYRDMTFDRSPAGEWSTGGWSMSVTVRGVADLDAIPDNALVVLWAEQYFDSVEYYINNTSTLMCGYIEHDTIRKNYTVGELAFDIYTIEHLLDNTVMRSVSLEYKTSGFNWYKYLRLTATRAVHHLLKWHSTLLEIADVILPLDDEDYAKAVDDFVDGSLYSTIDAFTYQHGIFAHACCDKYGRFHVARDIQFYDDTDRALQPIGFSITDKDRKIEEEIEVIRNKKIRLAYAIASGILYTGSGNPAPRISQAPGELPHARGDSETTVERLIMKSQAHSNMLVGRLLALANREIEEIRMPLTGNYIPTVDIVPQEWIALPNISNKREVNLQGRYVVRSVETDISNLGVAATNIVLEPEAFGPDGIPGPYPPGISTPNDPGDPDAPPAWSSGINTVMILSDVAIGPFDAPAWQGYVAYTNDFTSTTSSWEVSLIDGVDGYNVFGHDIDELDLAVANTSKMWVTIYNLQDDSSLVGFFRWDGASWTLLYSVTQLQITEPGSRYKYVAVNPLDSTKLVVTTYNAGVANNVWISSDSGDTLTIAYGFGGTNEIKDIVYIANGYILALIRNTVSGSVSIWRSVDDGNTFSLLSTIGVITDGIGYIVPALYNRDHIMIFMSDQLHYSLDGGTTIITPVLPGAGVIGGACFGNSSLLAVITRNDLIYYTTNGLVNWTDISIPAIDGKFVLYEGAYANKWIIDNDDQGLFELNLQALTYVSKTSDLFAELAIAFPAQTGLVPEFFLVVI